MSSEALQVVKEIEGVELPKAGTWEIDPSHSTVEFVARHMLTKARGRFDTFSGTLHVDEVPESSSVEVQIAAASIDTNTEDRDKHLRSPDFLDAESYPTLEFHSTSVRPRSGNRFDLVGDLTIRDVTREVLLETEYVGVHDTPFGTEVATFSARTEIDREEFGLTWNVAIETGGWLVGRNVQIELEVEAVYQA